MVKDGYLFSAPFFLAGVLGLYFGWTAAALSAFGLGGFILLFFRNPEREIPQDPGLVVSPADGKVVGIESREDGNRVSIFLSVFNVHVVRSPVGGKIVDSIYRKGKFLLAFDERASLENEQQIFVVEGERKITFSLIAGLVARRIIPWKMPGEQVARGDRMALIRFGSRVDIWIPPECDLNVRIGDRVRGGSSVLARSKEPV